MKIYHCEGCDKILLNLGEQNGTLGKTELIPGSVDAAVEKHVPVVEISKNTVTVKIGWFGFSWFIRENDIYISIVV